MCFLKASDLAESFELRTLFLMLNCQSVSSCYCCKAKEKHNYTSLHCGSDTLHGWSIQRWVVTSGIIDAL